MLKLQFVKGSTLEKVIKRMCHNVFLAPFVALLAFFVPLWCLPFVFVFWGSWCAYTAFQAYNQFQSLFSALKNSEPRGRTDDV